MAVANLTPEEQAKAFEIAIRSLRLAIEIAHPNCFSATRTLLQEAHGTTAFLGNDISDNTVAYLLELFSDVTPPSEH